MNETWLAHHGIKGQKWGVRRYQNKDGSLTAAGRKHVGVGEETKKEASSDKKDTKNKSGLDSKKLSNFAKDVYAYNDGSGFEKWYKKGNLDKKLAEINDTKSKLTSLMTDKEKKIMLDHLAKSNDLKQKVEDHQRHMEEARRVGNDVVKRMMGAEGNKKLDKYGNTVGQELAHEILQQMKIESGWKDEWYKEQLRLERLDAAGKL